MGKELGYTKMEDWYQVSAQDFHARGVAVLMQRHGSFSRVVMNVFKDHPWQIWKFDLQNAIWEKKSVLADYMKYPVCLFIEYY